MSQMASFWKRHAIRIEDSQEKIVETTRTRQHDYLQCCQKHANPSIHMWALMKGLLYATKGKYWSPSWYLPSMERDHATISRSGVSFSPRAVSDMDTSIHICDADAFQAADIYFFFEAQRPHTWSKGRGEDDIDRVRDGAQILHAVPLQHALCKTTQR